MPKISALATIFSMSKEAEPRLYEIGYMIDGRLDGEKAQIISDKIGEILNSSKSMIMETTPLKLQRLAYPVKRLIEAYCGWTKFTLDTGELAEIKLKITRMPEVIRSIAVETRPERAIRRTAVRPKKKVITVEEAARTEEIDKKLEEILGT